MRRAIIILIFFSVCIFLTSCSNDTTYEYYNQFQDVNSIQLDIDISGVKNVTDFDMDTLFRRDYGWDKLKNQELFFNGNCVVFNVTFNKEVPYWQIRAARDYAIIYLYNGRYNNIAPTSYDNWRVFVKPEAVFVNIYIDDELVVQDYLDSKNELHYENTRVNPLCKNYDTELAKKVKTKLEKISKCNLNYMKSLTRDGIILQFYDSNQINPEKIPLLLDVSEQLSEEFTRVILEFYSQDNLYYDCFFYNNKWQNGKWTN